MSNRKFSPTDWNNRHFARTEEFAHRIQMIYQAALKEAARLAITLNVDPDKPFSFADYPTVQARVAALMQDLASQMQSTILSGQEAEWSFANQKNDAFVQSISALSQLPQDWLDRYMNRNLEALSAFQQRKVAGLGLSDRIWKYTGQFKRELELGLDIGLGEGRSAQEISQGLRTYLNDPEKLFRRVRNKRGSLVLSKAAKDYHPGQGTYRSSYKNAMRLARTEINMAYREADHIRHQQLDFVVGIEVRRSNNPYGCDICESLKGRYPKSFKFVGWHPNCRCYTLSILATPEELSRLNRMILANEDTATFQSVNEVTEVNPGFTSWANENRDRLAAARTPPLFIQDNQASLPVAPAIPAIPAKPVSVYAATQQAGYTVKATSEDHFNNLYNDLINGFDFIAFDQEVSPLFEKAGLTITGRTLTARGNSLEMLFEGVDKKKKDIFLLGRTFSRDKNKVVVDHDIFTLPKKNQGGGLSREVFQTLYKQYRSANIDLIRVHANIDVGGYAWARYGFTFQNQADRRMVLVKARQKLSLDELTKFKEFWKDIENEPIFPMQAVAKSPWGKKILLGSDWNGLLDLNNPAQVQLFEDYLFRR